MEFLIISGLSGAGKSCVADTLEDMDYYCVDNMPMALLSKFAKLCLDTSERYQRVAIVTDARELADTNELFSALDELCESGLSYKILFMEAEKETIIKRYKATRRPHPLIEKGSDIGAAIDRDMQLLAPLRARADYIIDTSGLTTAMLRNRVRDLFPIEGERSSMGVAVTAFGFKYGLPMDADLVFDVRFLPNPFYIPELRDKTGLDDAVSGFVFSHEETKRFMEHLERMLDFLIPLYAAEGKFVLNIAIGCTGGRHRSVAISRALAERLAGQGMAVSNIYRDIGKE